LFEEFGGLVKGRGFGSARFERDGKQSPYYPLPPFGAGANMITMPGVLERIGGFDAALGAGTPARGAEDTLAFTEVLTRGGAIVYWPRAIVRHHHRRELDGLRDQLYGYGVGLTAYYTALAMRQPSSLFHLARLAPAALRDLLGASGQREGGVGSAFPPELMRIGRVGMLHGPAAYLRGRRACRRSRRTVGRGV